MLATYSDCRTPDIDVDGDGLEAFCESDPNAMPRHVDVCIDGDGTVVMDTTGSDGKTIHCTEAKKDDGSFRFVDGISLRRFAISLSARYGSSSRSIRRRPTSSALTAIVCSARRRLQGARSPSSARPSGPQVHQGGASV